MAGGLIRRRAVGALAALSVLQAGPAAAGLLDFLGGPAATVKVTRTSHDVAHVEATDEQALAFGIGYAQAQDHVCADAEALVTVRGERARWFGADASGTLGQRVLPNRVIDLFVRGHMDDGRLARAWQDASASARARARGVVDGFNRYLEDARGHLPPECAGRGWVQPMTLAELRRLGELLMIEDGLAAWADAVVGAQPPADNGVPARPAWLPLPPVDGAAGAGRAGRPEGSNALAFGRDASLSGQGLLLANPHLPWQGSQHLWQVHLSLPGQPDVMGVTPGLLPVVAIGFNASLAWSHTTSTARHFTLHELRLAPGNPRAYLVDGQVEPMVSRLVRIAERGPDAQLHPADQLQWSTRYGPVVVAPTLGLEWTPTRAYALQDVNAFNARWLDTWLAVDRAGDTGALRQALRQQGLPWMTTVAADREGRVFFADTSGVPDVAADRLAGCAASPEAARLWARAGLAVLDGTRSACDWARDPASLVPGAMPPDRLPQLERWDWVQSTGEGFWLANPAARLAGFGPLVGSSGTALGLRTRAALRGIAARLEGRDDRALHQRMGPEELIGLFDADLNLAAGIVLDDLLAACPGAPSEASRAGCAVLAAWDRTDQAGARGAHVFREFWRRARGIPGLWRVPFDPADPVYTPYGMALAGPGASPSVRASVFDALGQAVHALRELGLPLDARLGDLQQHASPAGAVPLGGGEAFEGVLNTLTAAGVSPLTRRGYDLDGGASYLQLVAFDADGPQARGLLTYGQSSRPGSPHAFDQLPAYAAGHWYRLPFRPEEVAADRVGEPLVLRYRPSPGDAGDSPAPAAPASRPLN